MQTGLRYRRAWMVLGWVAVAIALALNLMPSEMTPELANDKFEHSSGYLALTLWFCGIYPRSRYWIVAASLLGMGILVEILQGAMHWGRHADVNDVVADAVGIGIGVVFALTIFADWPRRIEALFASND